MEKWKALKLKPETLLTVSPLLHGNMWNGGGGQKGSGMREPCQGSGTSVRDTGVWGTYHLPANILPARSHRLPEGLPVGPI